MNNIANSCIWGSTMQAVLNKLGCLPISPNWTKFDFFNNFWFEIRNGTILKILKAFCIKKFQQGQFYKEISIKVWLFQKVKKSE